MYIALNVKKKKKKKIEQQEKEKMKQVYKNGRKWETKQQIVTQKATNETKK